MSHTRLVCIYTNYQKVKELIVQNRRDIWTLSDDNGTLTSNHLVHKRTLKYLAKPILNRLVWLNGWVFVYESKWSGAWVPLQSLRGYLNLDRKDF